MNEWLENVDGDRYVINIWEMIKLLIRNIWIIILATLVLGGGAYAYSTFCIVPLYQSSVKMYVNNTTYASDATSITSADIAASQTLVYTYAVVLTSKPTISAVIEQTGVDYSYEALCSMISTTAIDDTEIFRVTVTSADPVEAAEIANAIAEIAPDQIAEIVSGSSVKIVEYASVATSRSSPNRTKYALMGAMIGFILSCGGILLLSLLRNGMSVEEKMRRDFKDKPVLSVIPLMGKNTKGKHSAGKHGMGNQGKGKRGQQDAEEGAKLCDELNFATTEAYKLLRENISFYFSDAQACHIIGLTSSVSEEGKTTTAINLAYTLALANKKVCLIDCDFRVPAVSRHLHLHRKPGMTNFLAGRAEGSNVLQKYSTATTSFYVIAAGDVPPNPSELLGSKRMQDVLRILGKNFDYLILDLPPVGVVSDALTLSKVIDGMLFVVREDYYERKILRESLHTLEAVDTKLLGMVVTRSTTQEKEYKRYGEKYESRYGYGGYDRGENTGGTNTDANTDLPENNRVRDRKRKEHQTQESQDTES